MGEIVHREAAEDGGSFNPALVDALQDAQILVAFASRNGIAIPDNDLRAIAEARAPIARRKISEEQELNFWKSFCVTSNKIAPVTLSSLKATLDSAAMESKMFGVVLVRGSLARQAVYWYTAIAIITLGFLLVFQIYWLFGTSVVAEIQRADKEINEVSAQRELKKASTAADAKEQMVRLKVTIDNAVRRKLASYELLGLWAKPWDDLIPAPDCTCVADDMDLKINIARSQTANVVLESLQRYMLPLLYGLLGTCVFVLRTLTSEIRGRTYSEASNIGFRIRLYLGMLGGMVFAWFITPEVTDSLLRSLSPFALAFLAGYSVELLFAAMDRFLGAFTGKGDVASGSRTT